MLKLKKYDTANPIPSRRFEYQPGVAFWIRPLNGTILRNLRKQCTKEEYGYNPETQRMELAGKTDNDKLNELLADYIIDKWEGIGGEDGQPLPVNLESKKLIADQLALKNFIWAAAESLDTTEPETKNSQTSPASL